MITSNQNPQVKAALKLHTKKKRTEEGTFLIEGYREIQRALENQVELEKLFFSRSHFLGSNEEALLQKAQDSGCALLEVAPYILDKMTYRDRSEGLLAVGKTYAQDFLAFSATLNKKDPLLVVCQSLEKPGNLGTILRSSQAFGVDGVIVLDPVTDIFNPNVVRSSIGLVFSLPVFTLTDAAFWQFVEEKDFHVVATTPHTENPLHKVDMQGPTIIAVGTEQVGLTEDFMEKAYAKALIPMHQRADSFNVSAALAIALYECQRQRSFAYPL